MKKIVLSFLSVVAATTLLQAQSLKFGIKAGANLSEIDGTGIQGRFKFAYHAGGFAEIDLIGKIGIQPELLFSQTNSQAASNIQSTIPSLSTLQDVKLSYLSIPVLLRYNVAKFVTLNLGPQYSILIDKSKTLVENGKSAVKSGDFSVVAGAQIHISSIRVYGRYVLGLTEISDIEVPTKWKTQQLQVGVGFQL